LLTNTDEEREKFQEKGISPFPEPSLVGKLGLPDLAIPVHLAYSRMSKGNKRLMAISAGDVPLPALNSSPQQSEEFVLRRESSLSGFLGLGRIVALPVDGRDFVTHGAKVSG
jgi:hypothetical protein